MSDSINKALEAKVLELASVEKPPAREKTFQRGDDVEIAADVVGVLQKDAPWVHSAEQFWSYENDSGAWEPQHTEDIRALVMTYAGRKVFAGKDKAGEDITRALKLNSGRVEGTVRCAQTLLHQEGYFDQAPPGIAFKNSFVSISDVGEIIQIAHGPENRARFSLPYAYREHGCPQWRAFLRDLFIADEDILEKIECIREFVGLCLLGRIVPFEKSLILFGAGSNGKSVLLQTILDIFPPKARSSVPPQMWMEDYHLARLDGSAINVVSELPQRELLESNSLKQVISGDLVTARRPRENPFDFRPRAGHIFASNPPLPQVNDFSPGFWRRWTLIAFNRAFTGGEAEAKERLLAKLKEEIPGIVYWAIEGAGRAIRRGSLQTVKSSTAALDRWRKGSDQVATFLEEEVVESKDAEFSVDDVYRGYRSWCARSGHKMIGRTRFRERLEALNVKASQDAAGRWFVPVRVRPQAYGSDD